MHSYKEYKQEAEQARNNLKQDIDGQWMDDFHKVEERWHETVEAAEAPANLMSRAQKEHKR